jgi:GT2 family glycosyltransferase
MRNAEPVNDLDFSVIVPTFDRPSELAACLGALGQQDYEHAAFEVIVVDDGGRGVLDATMASLPAAISRKLLRQTNAGPAAARNRGAANARGTWLAFTDDDCRPAPGWLSAIARRLGQAPGCAVGGRTLNGATDSYFAEASQAIIEAVYRHYNADPDHARFFAAANLAVPAAAFRSVGGFDEGFRTSEDREFCDRWLHEGGRLLHAPEAIVWHDGGPRTLVHFWKQHFGYGRGARRFRGLAASRSSIPIKLESARFYRRLLCSPMREGINPRSLLVATLAVASQLASACGYWAEGRQAEVGPPAGTAGDAARACGRRL